MRKQYHMKKITKKDFKELSSQELGCSGWVVLSQDKVNQFADVTEDHQFIHIDVEAAKKAGLGGTIVHGFFLLSLASKFLTDLLPKVEGSASILNYGLNKVRFIAPVAVGSRVRGRVSLIEVADKGNGALLCTTSTTLEIEGQDKPAYVAEQLNLFLF